MRRWLAETRVYAGITLAVYFDMIPRLTTDAVATGSDHAGAEFVEDLERGLVAVQAKLALELDGRDAWRMARNEVGGPEPDRQRRAGPLMTVPAASALSR